MTLQKSAFRWLHEAANWQPVSERRSRTRIADPQRSSRTAKRDVSGPEAQPPKSSRGEKSDVDPAKARGHQSLTFDECSHLQSTGDGCLRQSVHCAEQLVTMPQVSARELSGHPRVRAHDARRKKLTEVRIGDPQVRDPDRAIDEDHASPWDGACSRPMREDRCPPFG